MDISSKPDRLDEIEQWASDDAGSLVLREDVERVEWLIAEVERQRSALTQIENWVGKEYRDLAEAEQIRDFIDKACEEGLGSR